MHPGRSSDSRALLVSVWASVSFAVVSLAWGLALDSQLIIFDGLYSFASVGLSLLAVLALRAASRGPTSATRGVGRCGSRWRSW